MPVDRDSDEYSIKLGFEIDTGDDEELTVRNEPDGDKNGKGVLGRFLILSAVEHFTIDRLNTDD